MSYLPKEGKILALDFGTRKTGVAITDALQRVAFLRQEIRHSNLDELKTELTKLIADEGIVGIVIGLPLKLDGEETEQTRITKDGVTALKLNLPILFVDERLTSTFAKENPLEDSRSAQILLERYLDRQK
ncbi:MAG: Holliday junction resolvase RuvX [Candidatus Gracilibacteria bacterium]